MILRRTPSGPDFTSALKAVLFLVGILEVTLAEYVSPDGGGGWGNNVIPLIRNKQVKPQPYNEGVVMAHVVGSAGMNFLYYFHLLGVACENRDPGLYKIIQNDFEFCLNKTGPLPSQIRNHPLGSIRKPCSDWELHRPCYKNLAVDYDECLVDKSGNKKGTDVLRFTHAYSTFICGNIMDTEAHLSDRYTKQDLIVNGVFQCFPHLQDRIVNCIKKDKVSKTLCSKFFIVHACFGKYYNDENCHDVQPIYYMDDLFRNMSTSLSCPEKDEHWYPTSPTGPTHQTPTGGWPSSSTPPRQQPPPPPTKGWTSREDYSQKENPWPGEQGRPWSLEREREPFIRDQYPGRPVTRPPNSNLGWESKERVTVPSVLTNGWGKVTDSHGSRPYPDKHWSNIPSWMDAVDRGTGISWGQRQGVGVGIDVSRGGSSGGGGGWGGISSLTGGSNSKPASSSTPIGPKGFHPSIPIPPTTTGGWSPRARSSQNMEQAATGGDDQKFSSSTSLLGQPLTSKMSNDDLGYNLYTFQ